MNFTDQQKSWLKLITLVFSTGAGVVVTAYQGGAKLWVSILLGLGVAATNVYHALSASPTKTTDQTK